MKYKALYRETRPEVFDEILGQESIVKILRHQVVTDTVSHAYLFTGTRGTGKTTTARILAKAVNCEAPDLAGRPCGKCEACRQIADGNFVDVIEIDAASNNGVDNIRELRESVNYPPAVGRVKVYIIDEVHMLSTGAFNALLKTLEEPPENVIFILATTNPEKLPQTVLSRCMRLDFKRIPQTVLAQHMKDICSDRGVDIDDDALRLLAANADGSVRDSLSILEQCLSSGEQHLTRDLVLDFLGAVSEEFYLELTGYVMSGDISSAFVLIDKAISDGKDVKQIMKDWMSHCRNLLIAKYVSDPKDLLNLSAENIDLLKKQAAGIGLAEIDRAIITLAKAINDSRYSTQARILLEVAVVSIASGTEYGEAPEVPVRPVAPAARQAAAPRVEQNPVAPAVDQKPAARVQAAAPAPKQEKAAPVEVLQDIWRDVCQEAAANKPLLNILSDCVPTEQKGDEIKLVVGMSMMKDIIDRDAAYINSLLKRFGATGHIVCVLDSGGAGNAKETLMDPDSAGAGNGPADDGFDDVPGQDAGEESDLEKARREASELLGIDVQIEE